MRSPTPLLTAAAMVVLTSAGISQTAPLPRYVAIRMHANGWNAAWLVDQDSARYRIVWAGHADTVWIPIADVSSLETVLAPALADGSQEMVGAVIGPRVRVRTHARAWQTGVLAVQDSTRLGLVRERNGGADTTWFARSDLEDVEESMGQRTHTGTGAAVGVLFGGAMGAVIGAATYQPSGGFIDFGQGLYAMAGGLVGAAFGGLVGSVVGSATTTDNWQPLERGSAQISLAPVRHGLGVSVAFRVR